MSLNSSTPTSRYDNAEVSETPLRLTRHSGGEPIQHSLRKHVPCEAPQCFTRILATGNLVQDSMSSYHPQVPPVYLFPPRVQATFHILLSFLIGVLWYDMYCVLWYDMYCVSWYDMYCVLWYDMYCVLWYDVYYMYCVLFNIISTGHIIQNHLSEF